LLTFYQLIITLLFILSFPVLFIYVLVTGKHRRGLSERLGLYRITRPDRGVSCRVWIHAASIGEIKAARIIVKHFRELEPNSSFILTTMTIHGRDFARSNLEPDIDCFLAPLDVPVITDIVVNRIRPDVYVCLETELWPLLIHKIHGRGAAAVLVNGRLSDKSIGHYKKLKFIFGRVLRCFDQIGAIGAKDQARFLELGAAPERLTITGNVKHDIVLPVDPEATRDYYRRVLALDADTRLFIAGSTHDPEEELLLPLFETFNSRYDLLWVYAPRHLDRVGEIEKLLLQHDISFDRLSDCKNGKERCCSMIIVDTFGDLSDLFSVASFGFIGGSLVDYGGHNLMEAAIWDKAVAYGPSMQDFQDIADELEAGGAGFRLNSVAELEHLMQRFIDHPAALETAGVIAGTIAREKQGVAALQAQLIHQALTQRAV
jgi:3-deoxy-D-manno-octulosonic-acid transferase